MVQYWRLCIIHLKFDNLTSCPQVLWVDMQISYDDSLIYVNVGLVL